MSRRNHGKNGRHGRNAGGGARPGAVMEPADASAPNAGRTTPRWHVPSDVAEALLLEGILVPTVEQTFARFPEVEASGGNMGGGGFAWPGQGNYVATAPGPSRGRVVWSTLDTRKELSRVERRELIRMSRSLVANCGLAGVLRTLARLCGAQRPQAMSSSKPWNDRTEKVYRVRAKSRLICDRRALYNSYQVQRLLKFLKFRDGECFVVLTETQGGRARYMIFEADRVWGAPPDHPEEERWFDGIRLDAGGAAMEYWFVDPDDSSKGVRLPARNVIHVANRDGLAPHGLPILTHAILDLLDIIETRGYTKASLKLAALLGLQEVNMDESETGPAKPNWSGLQTGVTPFLGATGVTGTTQTPEAGSPAVAGNNLGVYESVKVENMPATSILRMQRRRKIETLKDDRPSPNVREFQFDLLACVAIGLGLTPQFVYYIEKQTGPMQRFTIEQAAEWVAWQQSELAETFLDRWWAYGIAKDDKAGFLSGTVVPADPDDVEDDGSEGRGAGGKNSERKDSVLTRPEDWWAVTWQRPRSVASIDAGRDGRLKLEKFFAGLATLSDLLEPDGVWWEDHLAQQGVEIDAQIALAVKISRKWIQKEATVTFGFVFAQLKGGAKSAPLLSAGAEADSEDGDESDGKKEKKKKSDSEEDD